MAAPSETDIYLPDTLPFPIKVLSLPASPRDSITAGATRLLNYSFLHPAADESGKWETRYGSWDATFDGELKEWNIKVGEVVSSERAKEKHVLIIIEECSHGMQVNGLCALCGMDMEKCVLLPRDKF